MVKLTSAMRLHRARVWSELRQAGASRWAQWHTVFSRVAEFIHPSESIYGVVYGYKNTTFTLLVATERRILALSSSLFFSNEEELSYEVVAGISMEDHLFSTDFTLHTRITDFRIRTYNRAAARRLREYLEQRCLEHEPEMPFTRVEQQEVWRILPRPVAKRP